MCVCVCVTERIKKKDGGRDSERDRERERVSNDNLLIKHFIKAPFPEHTLGPTRFTSSMQTYSFEYQER